MRKYMILLAPCWVATIACAQSVPSAWQHVQQLPLHTRVHVSADSESRVCEIERVDEDKLACDAGRVVSTSHYTFARTEIKSIKLTRYVVSTVAGAGIGAGVGLATGVAVTQDHNTLLNFNGAIRGILAGVGGVLGGAIAGPTDAFRGPTVYRRP